MSTIKLVGIMSDSHDNMPAIRAASKSRWMWRMAE